ncbi:MAG: hypothetical protein J5970_01810 [Bacilli bacterium]|nr:hypothetical protein [Bacilli bacterium]
MNYIKKSFLIIIPVLFGIILGKYIYNISNFNTKEVFDETYSVYLLQYGVYSNEENMKNSTTELSNYFYFKDKKGYHVIIGIVKNKNNLEKIRDSYEITSNIYLKEVKITNMEFYENLGQYDNLISKSNDKNFIINAEKQVLSKYEELVLNNG